MQIKINAKNHHDLPLLPVFYKYTFIHFVH